LLKGPSPKQAILASQNNDLRHIGMILHLKTHLAQRLTREKTKISKNRNH
jgi:hypothetical protein